MLTPYLAHGSVLLTLLLLGLTGLASYVCLSVLIDFRGKLGRTATTSASSNPGKLSQQ